MNLLSRPVPTKCCRASQETGQAGMNLLSRPGLTKGCRASQEKEEELYQSLSNAYLGKYDIWSPSEYM
jgi:hypothetical protein